MKFCQKELNSLSTFVQMKRDIESERLCLHLFTTLNFGKTRTDVMVLEFLGMIKRRMVLIQSLNATELDDISPLLILGKDKLRTLVKNLLKDENNIVQNNRIYYILSLIIIFFVYYRGFNICRKVNFGCSKWLRIDSNRSYGEEKEKKL